MTNHIFNLYPWNDLNNSFDDPAGIRDNTESLPRYPHEVRVCVNDVYNPMTHQGKG